MMNYHWVEMQTIDMMLGHIYIYIYGHRHHVFNMTCFLVVVLLVEEEKNHRSEYLLCMTGLVRTKHLVHLPGSPVDYFKNGV